MAEKSKLSPSELARIKAGVEARKAKSASNKTAKPSKAEPKKAPSIDDIKQKIAEQQSKSSAFKDTLESGTPLLADSSAPKINAPTKISENQNYHNALYSVIDDFNNRVSQIQNQVGDEGRERAAFEAKKGGVSVDRLVDKSGKRRSFVDSTTLRKLDPAVELINTARKHLDNSVYAHHSGGAAGALTAAESFTKAGDHIAAALSHVRNAFGTSQKYKKVFNSPEYGNTTSPVNIDSGSNRAISDVVSGYTNHVLNRAKSAGMLPDQVVKEVQPQLSRDYDTVMPVPEVSSAMGRFAPKTQEEKQVASQGLADRRARQGEEELKNKAARGILNIVKPSEDYPSTPLSTRDVTEIPGASRTFPVSGTGAAELVGSYVTPPSSVDKSFRARYSRAQVQPVFEYNEKQNEESAAEMGKQYVKKTFVGSEAHTNPEAWHEKNQVRTHWIKSNKGRPEDFDSSEAAGDIAGYKAANNLETKPLEFDTRKASRLTVLTPNPKSTIQKMIFSPAPGAPKGEPVDRPMKGSLEAFHPTVSESKIAEEKNQIDVPESVNKTQLSRAKKSGAALSRKEGTESHGPKFVNDDPTQENVTTAGVAKAEEAKVTPRPEGRNIHFRTGAGE